MEEVASYTKRPNNVTNHRVSREIAGPFVSGIIGVSNSESLGEQITRRPSRGARCVSGRPRPVQHEVSLEVFLRREPGVAVLAHERAQLSVGHHVLHGQSVTNSDRSPRLLKTRGYLSQLFLVGARLAANVAGHAVVRRSRHVGRGGRNGTEVSPGSQGPVRGVAGHRCRGVAGRRRGAADGERQHEVAGGHPGHGGRLLVPVGRQGGHRVAERHELGELGPPGPPGPRVRRQRVRVRVVQLRLAVGQLRRHAPLGGAGRLRRPGRRLPPHLRRLLNGSF